MYVSALIAWWRPGGSTCLSAAAVAVRGRTGSATLRRDFLSDYVRVEVTLVGASWDVVAGDQTGVDFIPMKFCGVPSRLALFLAFLKPGMSIFPIKQYT